MHTWPDFASSAYSCDRISLYVEMLKNDSIAYKKKILFLLLLSWNTIPAILMYTTALMSLRAGRVFWKMIEHCLIMHPTNLFTMWFNSLLCVWWKIPRNEFLVIVIITSCPVLYPLSKRSSSTHSCINNCLVNNENLPNIDIECFHTWFNNPFNIRENH